MTSTIICLLVSAIDVWLYYKNNAPAAVNIAAPSAHDADIAEEVNNLNPLAVNRNDDEFII